ncbi:MAG: hypothetical protein JNG84_12095 [Archangium sp.]|nr:hypothetical protein [Archangium sp.]
MAKANKKTDSTDGSSASGPLASAYAAFERGDMVQTRALAKQVLAGQGAADDVGTARRLSAVLSSEVAPVKELPEDVAAELVRRTEVPPNAYIFAAVVIAIFGGLLALAATRYGA